MVKLKPLIKERKLEVTNDKYGMIQLSLKPNLEVYTMSKKNFINTYRKEQLPEKAKVSYYPYDWSLNETK